MLLTQNPETGEPLPLADEVTHWRLQLKPRKGEKGRPSLVREDGEPVELTPGQDTTEEDAIEHAVAGMDLLAMGFANKRCVIVRQVDFEEEEIPAEEEDTDEDSAIICLAKSNAKLAESIGTIAQGISRLLTANSHALLAAAGISRTEGEEEDDSRENIVKNLASQVMQRLEQAKNGTAKELNGSAAHTDGGAKK